MAVSWILLSLVHYVLALRTVLFSWIFGIRRLVIASYHKQTLSRLRADSKTLRKLPLHLGIVIAEDDLSYTDIANMLIWSIAMGISCISLYDHVGILKRSDSLLQEALEKQQSQVLGKEKHKFQVDIHKSRLQRRPEGGLSSSFHADVTLLSVEDGRRRLVETAKLLSRTVTSSQFKCEEITPANVDAMLLEGSGFPDPDLLLRFGQTQSTLGFLPWQIRLTEMLGAPSHHNIAYASFHQLITTYGNTQQRLGK